MIYFNSEMPNLILNDKKTGFRIEFQGKNGLFGHFWSKKHFFDVFQNIHFSSFLIFFKIFKVCKHIL